MKIAITGANGFLGSHLLKALAGQDMQIALFDRKKHDLLESSTLKEFVSGSNVVIHLAGVNRGSDEDISKINILGTQGLLEALDAYAPQAKLLFSSTFQVYRQDSLYGLSKKIAEELIAWYTKRRGGLAIIFRISNIYGPSGKPYYNSVISTFTHQAVKGETLVVNGTGQQQRDYIYIDDVVAACVAAIQYKPKDIEILDICSGVLTKLSSIAAAVSSLSEKKCMIEYNTDGDTSDVAPPDIPYSRARRLLDWEPQVALKDGLRNVMESLYDSSH